MDTHPAVARVAFADVTNSPSSNGTGSPSLGGTPRSLKKKSVKVFTDGSAAKDAELKKLVSMNEQLCEELTQYTKYNENLQKSLKTTASKLALSQADCHKLQELNGQLSKHIQEKQEIIDRHQEASSTAADTERQTMKKEISMLSEKCGYLQDQLDEANDYVDELKYTVEDLQRVNEDLQKKASESRGAIEVPTIALQEAEQKVVRLEGEVARMKEAKTLAQGMISVMEEKMQKVSDYGEELKRNAMTEKKRAESLEQELGRANSRYEELEAQLQSMQEDHLGRLDEIEKNHSLAVQQYQSAMDQLRAGEEKVFEHEQLEQHWSQMYEQTKKSLEAKILQHKKLQERLGARDNAFRQLESHYRDACNDKAELEAALQREQKRSSDLEKEISSTSGRLEAVQKTLLKEEGKHAAISGELRRLQELDKEREVEMMELQEEKSKLESQLEGFNERLQAAKEVVSTVESDFQLENTQREATQRENDDVREQLAALQAMLATLENENADLKTCLGETADQVEDTVQKLLESEQRATSLEEEMQSRQAEFSEKLQSSEAICKHWETKYDKILYEYSMALQMINEANRYSVLKEAAPKADTAAQKPSHPPKPSEPLSDSVADPDMQDALFGPSSSPARTPVQEKLRAKQGELDTPGVVKVYSDTLRLELSRMRRRRSEVTERVHELRDYLDNMQSAKDLLHSKWRSVLDQKERMNLRASKMEKQLNNMTKEMSASTVKNDEDERKRVRTQHENERKSTQIRKLEQRLEKSQRETTEKQQSMVTLETRVDWLLHFVSELERAVAAGADESIPELQLPHCQRMPSGAASDVSRVRAVFQQIRKSARLLADLRGRMTATERELGTCKTELEKTSEKLKDSEECCAKLQCSEEEVRQQLDTLSSERDRLSSELTSTSEQLKQVTGSRDKAEEEATLLRKSLDEVQATAAEQKQTVELQASKIQTDSESKNGLKSTVRDLKSRVTDLQQRLDAVTLERDTVTSRLESIEGHYKRVSERRNALQRRNRELVDDLREAREKEAMLSKERSNLESQLSSAQSECKELNSKSRVANERRLDAASQIRQLRDKVSEQEELVLALEQKVDGLTEQYNAERSRAISLEEDLSAAVASAQHTVSSLAEKDRTIASLERDVSEAEGQVEDLQAQFAVLQDECTAAQEIASDMQKQCGDRDRRIAELEERLSAHVCHASEPVQQSVVTAGTEDVKQDSLAAEVKDLNGALRQHREQIASLELSVQVAESAVRAAESKLDDAESKAIRQSERIGDLMERGKKQDAKVGDLQAQLKNKDTEAKELEKKLEQVTQKHDQAVSEKRRIRGELIRAQKNLKKASSAEQHLNETIAEAESAAVMQAEKDKNTVIADSKAQVVALEAQLREFENAMRSKDDLVTQLEQQRDGLQRSLRTVMNESNELRSTVQEWVSRHRALAAQTDELQQENAVLKRSKESELKSMQTRFGEVREVVDQLKRLKDQSDQQLGEKLVEISGLQGEKQELQRRLHVTEKDLASMRVRLQRSEKQVSAKADELEEMQQQLDERSSELASMKSRLASLHERCSQQQSALRKAKDSACTEAESAAKKHGELKELERKVSKAASALEKERSWRVRLQDESRAASTKSDELQAEVARLTEKMTLMEKQHSRRSTMNEKTTRELKLEIHGLKMAFDSAQEKLEKAENRERDLTHEVHSKEEAVEQLTCSLKDAEDDIKALADDCSQLKEQLETVTLVRDELAVQLEVSREANTKHREELQIARSETAAALATAAAATTISPASRRSSLGSRRSLPFSDRRDDDDISMAASEAPSVSSRASINNRAVASCYARLHSRRSSRR